MTDLIRSLAESFKNNLIAEDRYRMILDGLQVTLLITLCAALLGTLLGGLVCWMRMSRRKWLQQIAQVYIEIMRGTPVLVVLMLMYYVIMAPLDATGIVVAIITFGMNTAAYISEMLRTAIQGIDRGQTEAGLALGYTPRQTFFRIVLPQVIRAVMPVYQGEVVSLLKGTSIVGYIAVTDMTRASDLIRSRTFEAFFPLIVTAAVSYGTIRGFERYSIYTKRIAAQGALLTHDNDQAVLTLLHTADLVERDFTPVRYDATLGDLVHLISTSRRNLFPVLDAQGRFQGVVTLDDVRSMMFDRSHYDTVKVYNVMKSAPAFVYMDEKMDSVMNKFESTQAWNLPVLDDENKYLGFVSKSKIFSSYRDQLKAVSDE